MCRATYVVDENVLEVTVPCSVDEARCVEIGKMVLRGKGWSFLHLERCLASLTWSPAPEVPA